MFVFYGMCFKEKNPMTKGADQRPKFVRVEGENCTYGPTLQKKVCKTAPARWNEKHQNGALFDHHFLVLTARENQNEVF